MRHLIIVQFFCFWSATALAGKLYTIEVKHRSAESIAQAIEPILPKDTQIQAYANQLLINTTEENYQNISNIVSQLDTPLQLLRIKAYNGNVAPSNTASITEKQYELGTDSNTDDNRYIRSTSRERDRKTDEILVLSGETAHIETQITLPLLNRQYAYRDTSSSTRNLNSNATETSVLNAQSSSGSVNLPAITGARVNVPTNDQLQPGNTLIEVGNPIFLNNRPIVVPNMPGQNFEVEAQQSTTNAISNAAAQTAANAQFQANQGASDQTYEYHQLHSGLMVRPTFLQQSDKVLLEILTKSTHRDHQNEMDKKAYSGFQVHTKMLIPMNQWVYIGGNRLDKPDDSSYRFRTTARERQNQHLWIYLEKAQQ